MDANEIMNNEVIETTEEIAYASSGKGFKVVAGIGLVVVAGVLAYKYFARPFLEKLRARKQQNVIELTEVEAVAIDEEDTEEA